VILLTGASGFIGTVLLAKLKQGGDAVRPVYRRTSPVEQDTGVVVPTIVSTTAWECHLGDVHVVVHLAARVHVMKDIAADPLAEFREVNVGGTLSLASQAARHGVKRFVYISSIKVNGEWTPAGSAYYADDIPNPVDPYAISKCEAEAGLRLIAAETGMEVVIIRPVLVYGPNVKGNFLSMMKWLHRGLPLPFGAVRNLRSIVGVHNLVDLIYTCLRHPAAANQTFLASDGEDISTAALLRRTAAAMEKDVFLIPVPQILIEASATLMGRRDVARRICGSLQVDIGKTRELLGWLPSVSVDQELRDTADHFLAHQAG
jgi:nucleoside-diphosphate-sugar epimerase